MMKKIGSLFFGLSVLAVAWFLWNPGGEFQPLTEVRHLLKVPGKILSGDKNELNSVDSGSPGSSNSEAPVSTDFIQWVTQEAFNMEKSSVDPQVKEAELVKRAQSLSPAELRYLKEKSLNLSTPANERILSTYLLTLAPEKTSEVLQEIMQEPLRLQGSFPVHSPEEVLAMQEKSLRRMAVDALLGDAQKHPEKRNSLEDAISQIKDPVLKEYAEKSYRKIQ